MTSRTVLLLGSTGRTGGRALRQLLDRDVHVRTVVRDAGRLPEGLAGHPALDVTAADLLSLSASQVGELVQGCDAVVSCLGHTISIRGVLGPPYDLVERALRTVCAEVSAPTLSDEKARAPVRVVLMSSVSVNAPGRADTGRGAGQRAFLAVTRALTPPARDNQGAADFLARDIGAHNCALEWVVVRPDTLRHGEVSPYRVTAEPPASIFRPAETAMANVAHFMGELVTDEETWRRWRFQMPVVTNDPTATDAAR
jgi:nucleoside-diphosphate-sugar epimerase